MPSDSGPTRAYRSLVVRQVTAVFLGLVTTAMPS